jgi:hypothetical protein
MNLLNDNTVKVVTAEFAKKLIDSIEFIINEETLHTIVSILFCVLPYFEETRQG